MSSIRKSYADTRHGQIHYRIAGSLSTSAAPVLFFHRTPVTSASYEAVLAHLGDCGRALVAFDTPGFGESFTPPAGTAMDVFVTAFLDAIDMLGFGSFHLVGHHTGAHFATELALAAPDRTLSLMLDGAMVLSAEQRAQNRTPAPPVVVDEEGAYAMAAWKFLRPYYTIYDPACIHQEFVGALRSTFTRDACMALVRVHDMADAVSRVTCPLMLSAASDDVFVDHIQPLAALKPDAVTQIYGAAGIAAPELQTEAFCKVVLDSIARSKG